LEMARVPPSILDRALGATLSVGLDALLVGFAVLVGENPDSVLTWLGLSLFGIIPRVVEAAYWRSSMHLLPFWGTFLRGENLVEVLRGHGYLLSQREIRLDVMSFGIMGEDNWAASTTSFRFSCGRFLLAALDDVIAQAPYGKLPNGEVNFPPPVSTGRFSASY
jgi:hypothetical protein